MEQPKYKIEDIVWYIGYHDITSTTVVGVKFNAYVGEDFTYFISDDITSKYPGEIDGSYLFSTREELVKHLIEQ